MVTVANTSSTIILVTGDGNPLRVPVNLCTYYWVTVTGNSIQVSVQKVNSYPWILL